MHPCGSKREVAQQRRALRGGEQLAEVLDTIWVHVLFTQISQCFPDQSFVSARGVEATRGGMLEENVLPPNMEDARGSVGQVHGPCGHLFRETKQVGGLST